MEVAKYVIAKRCNETCVSAMEGGVSFVGMDDTLHLSRVVDSGTGHHG